MEVRMATISQEPPVARAFGMKAETGRWIFVALGLIIQLCLGAVYSWSIFIKPLQTDFNYSAMGVLLPYMIFLALFAITMPFGGRFIQRFGPRLVCVAGGALTSLGWILAGFANSLPLLCLTYGVIGGIGVGLAYGAPIQVSTRWFPDRKGLAVGLTVGGFGLSALVIVNLGTSLINSFGVLHTFTYLGIAFLIISVLFSLLLRFPAPNWKPQGWKPATKGATAVITDFSSSAMVKTKSFWGLWACFTIGALAGLMAIGIAKPSGQEIVLVSAATATTLTSVFAIFNGGGRPIFGWLTDKITPRYTAVISFVLIGLGSLGMLFAGANTTTLYVICFAFFYLALGGWLAIAPTATVSFFGPKYNSVNYGIVFTAYGVGAVVGNIISGMSKDIYGSYVNAFYYTAGLAILGLILAIFLLRQPKAG